MKGWKKACRVGMAVAWGFTFMAGAVLQCNAQSLVPPSVSSSLTPLTANPSFDAGLNGWNGDDAGVTVVPGGTDLCSRTASMLANLDTAGGFSQWILIHPDDVSHVVSLLARAIDTNPSSGAWAGFGLVYFDLFGNFLSQTQREIVPSDTLDAYSFGARVPKDATSAVIWIWTSSSDRSLELDDFRLSRLKTFRFKTNEVITGFDLPFLTDQTEPIDAPEPTLPIASLSGREFWNVSNADRVVSKSRFRGGGKGSPVTANPPLA